jgi:transporter family protein
MHKSQSRQGEIKAACEEIEMTYIQWALTGMVSYSFVTLFVKLATKDGRLSSFAVLAFASIIVGIATLTVVLYRGDLSQLAITDLIKTNVLWSYAVGIALTIAVMSLFKALSLGPATVVVPIYGMFIIGGAILGIVFLGEPIALRKIIGILLAALSIYLIAG